MSLVFVSAVAEEWVLVDNESIVVKIKEFGEDSMWGHTMKVYMENKTDKLLMYSIDSCAVNGVMNDPFWAKEVMAGSKANAEVSWFDMKGNASNIGITQLDFSFRVYDSEDWMADALLDQSYTIYPKGESSVAVPTNTPTATPTAEPTPSPIPVLKKGMNGEAVKQMQSQLKRLGYLQAEPDGDFGSMTETAVKDFQKKNGLQADGMAGSQTLTLMFSNEAKKQLWVWIPTKGGKKHHANQYCSDMVDPEYVKLEEAERRGFTPCGKKSCY